MHITIVPVAHVSKESVRRVKEAIAELKPQYVAVELDTQRLRALVSGIKPSLREMIGRPLFALMYLFQRMIGQGMGILPGSEMLAAVEAAKELKIPVVLVDRPIQETAEKLARIPLGEKLTIALQIFLAPLAFVPGLFSKEKLPSIDELTDPKNLRKYFKEFELQLPNTYRILVEERDDFMLDQLAQLKAESVVLVVGAGHVPGLSRRIREWNKRQMEGGIGTVGNGVAS